MWRRHLLGFTESYDPYSESNAVKFTDNLTLWPRVEYGHIFGYFVTRPGLYTQDQLLAFSALHLHGWINNNMTLT